MTSIVSATLLRTQSDARLVELAREGHERAFEAIVERYRRPLHRYVRRMLPSARVEDVLQVSFLNAWSSLKDGSEVRDLRPWLYRIVHNAAVNQLKRKGYDFEELRESLKGSDGPDTDVERQAVMRETLASVAALPERQRRALLETAVDGREPHVVAKEMGLSDGAFRQLVFRARATLRAAATAVTPLPFAAWAATLNVGGGGDVTATRIAELAGGAGGAGVAATVAKTGAAVVAAGALVAGGTGAVERVSNRGDQDQSAAFAAQTTTAADDRGLRGEPEPGDDRGGANELGDDNRDDNGDRRGRGRGGDDNSSGKGSSGSGKSDSGKSDSGDSGSDDSGDDSSGSDSSGDDSSGSGSSGSGGDDSSDKDSSGSGSGSSGSGRENTEPVESGSSDSGSSGSTESSGSDSLDSGSSDSSGSGSSGSSGSDSSGSGSSGSDSSESGSGGGD